MLCGSDFVDSRGEHLLCTLLRWATRQQQHHSGHVWYDGRRSYGCLHERGGVRLRHVQHRDELHEPILVMDSRLAHVQCNRGCDESRFQRDGKRHVGSQSRDCNLFVFERDVQHTERIHLQQYPDAVRSSNGELD